MAKELKSWEKPKITEYSQKIIQSGANITLPESMAATPANYAP